MLKLHYDRLVIVLLVAVLIAFLAPTHVVAQAEGHRVEHEVHPMVSVLDGTTIEFACFFVRSGDLTSAPDCHRISQ